MRRLALIVVLSGAAIAPAAAQDMLWTRQVGTNLNDQGYAVATDEAGNVLIAGYTNGALGGAGLGGYDYYLFKYDAAGTLLWSRQGGTSADDYGHGVATDAQGNIYVAGYTAGSLGGPNAGSNDIFLVKYDASGTMLWSRQAGTAGTDQGYGVDVDDMGNVFVAGYSTGSLGGPNAGGFDACVVKYDSAGNLLWSRQAGSTTTDIGLGMGVDANGNAYVAGYTAGDLGGPNLGSLDVFVVKYDPAGAVVWARQAGSDSTDIGLNLAVADSGEAFVCGYSFGAFGGPHAGSGDAILCKFSPAGSLEWTRQPGTSASDQAYGVTVDSTGNSYLAGFTEGSLGGPNAGSYDAFLAKYDSAGTSVSTVQFGTTAEDRGIGAAVDASGSVLVTGPTYGNLSGTGAGGSDVYVAKFGSPCYADCDTSTGGGTLDIFDFLCFQNKFAANEPYACECDTSTGPGVCDIFDFLCFQNAFAAGCP